MGIILNIDNFLKNGMIKKDLSDKEIESLSRSEILLNSAFKSIRGTFDNPSIKCSDINSDKTCTAELQIVITDIPNELRWSCAACGNEGVIQNWRRSPLYKKTLMSREIKNKKSGTVLELSKENFTLLKNTGSSKGDLFIIFNCAVETDNKYKMHIAEFDMLRILELIAEKIRKNPEKKEELLSLKKEIVDSFYCSKN